MVYEFRSSNSHEWTSNSMSKKKPKVYYLRAAADPMTKRGRLARTVTTLGEIAAVTFYTQL